MSAIERGFILSIGAEILTGRTLDRNGNRLAKLLTGLGLEVLEIRAVGDDVDVVADSICQQFDRAGDVGALIVTTGGLGATPDDLTLAAVAQACGVELVASPGVRDYVEDRYRRLQVADSGQIDIPMAAVEKLSRIPQNARWVPNPVGVAPGVITPQSGGYVYSLPGVPREAFGIFESAASADALSEFGIGGGYCEMITRTDAQFETQFDNAISAMSRQFPGVLVKPLPERFGPDVRMMVRVACRAESFEQARQTTSEAVDVLRSLLEDDGISSEPPSEA